MKRFVCCCLALAVAAFAPAAPAAAKNPPVTAQLVKGGLDFPAAFDIAPDGRIFYGELSTGEIHILAGFGPS